MVRYVSKTEGLDPIEIPILSHYTDTTSNVANALAL
jgi:hypothetical protein